MHQYSEVFAVGGSVSSVGSRTPGAIGSGHARSLCKILKYVMHCFLAFYYCLKYSLYVLLQAFKTSQNWHPFPLLKYFLVVSSSTVVAFP